MIPETMLMMAVRLGLAHWQLRKRVTEGGKGVVEKEPGMRRMSNCGAF
jgi:hypothetical protein